MATEDRTVGEGVAIPARELVDGRLGFTGDTDNGVDVFVLRQGNGTVLLPMDATLDALANLRREYRRRRTTERTRSLAADEMGVEAIRDAIGPSLSKNADADAVARDVRAALQGLRQIVG